MTLLQKVSGLLIAVSLQACVSGPKYTPMTEEAKQAVTSARSYNLVLQDEIKPDVVVSNAGIAVGGLIGAMVDSSVNDSRATAARGGIQPLYDEIADVDYRVTLAAALNPVLNNHFNVANLKDSAETVLVSDKELKVQIKALEQGEALFFSTSFYQFRTQSRMLQALTQVFMFMQTDKPDVNKPNFYSMITYQSPLVGKGGEDSINLWAADNAKLFREQLQRSADEITKAIDYQMQTSLNEICLKGGEIQVPNALGTARVKGNVFEEDEMTSKLRSTEGDMYIVAKSSVQPAKVKTCVNGEKS
jgi:hypothetical protein